MARLHEGLRVGDQVSWETVHSTATGVVEELTEKGAYVRLPSGRYSLLSTHLLSNPISREKDAAR